MGLVVAVSLGVTQATVLYLAHVQPLRLHPVGLHRLATLRRTVETRLLTAVSPDDMTIVTLSLPHAGRGGSEPGIPQWAFLNVEDGSTRAIDAAALKAEPESDVVWRDDRTAVYLSANKAGSPLLVELDRASGSVVSSTLRLPGRPISLAPNASRLLIEMTGTEGATLASFDLQSSEVMPLVTYPGGGGPSNIAWTPDGSKVALVRLTLPAHLAADQNGLVELAVQDALGELAPAQNPFFQGNVVDVFDLARGELLPAALKAVDGDGDLFHQLRWSTDGATLLAQMARPATLAGRRNPVYQFPDQAYFRFYDAALTVVGTLDRPEVEAVLSTSATFISPHELSIVAPEGMTLRLYYFNRLTGELKMLPTGEGSLAEAPSGYQVHAIARSRQLIFNHSSFQQPPEVYRIGWDGTGMKALTSANATAAAANRIRVDALSVPLKDGATRTGYLLQPEGAAFPPRNVPIVLFQQGGPGGPMANRWGATAEEPFNLLPNFGIAVLVMTFPGREGFGPPFYNALKEGRSFGQLDIDEAAQAVEHLIAQGYTARDRVGITGCSYGGYFAVQSIIRHPDLYAVAVAQCTLLDLEHAYEFTGRSSVAYWEGRRPEADAAEYTADSPIHHAADVRSPLLLVHGTEDQLPVSMVEDFRDQIAAQGTPVELITFKGEGHGLSNPSSHMAAAQAQIRWFQTYLAGATVR
jgi:dipeptidyl aminopeptidase/acylaminoacyl peptidase